MRVRARLARLDQRILDPINGLAGRYPWRFGVVVGVFMGLLVFSLMMMTMLLAYLPGSVIRSQLFGPPPSKRASFKYNPKDEKQARAAATIAAFDSSGAVDFVESPVDAVSFTSAEGGTSMRGLPGLKWLGMFSFIPAVKRVSTGS